MKDEDIIVCRCEDVTLADLRRLIADGYDSIDELRRIARIGMGQCQGKNCRPMVLSELARAKGQHPGEIKLSTVRQPLVPVKLGDLAECFPPEAGGESHDDQDR